MSSNYKIRWDDEWILNNWEDIRNWAVLCRQYNAAHNTDIGYNTFKAHCNRDLGLSYKYTEEEDEWLIQNYPRLGRNKTYEEFNKAFSYKRSLWALHNRCIRLGLHVTDERLKERAMENTERFHPIGTKMVRGNLGVVIKTKDGWVRETDLAIGKAPKGCRTIHLDGDITNNDPSNLMHMTFGTCALMTRYELWSKHRGITKAGVKWCELYEILKESNA